jgi:hypothetical protein
MTGSQLEGQVQNLTPTNRIRVFLNSTVTFAPAGLTSKIFEIIQKLAIYKGKKDSITSGSQPVVLIDQAQLPRAAIFSAVRAKPGSVASEVACVNPVVAATTVTAFGYVDVFVDLDPGDYYYTIDVNPSTAYTGGASVIAAIAVNVAVHFIDEGRPVLQAEKVLVTLKSASPGFDMGNLKEFALMSATELSAGLSALKFDETFSATGVALLEEEANLKLQGAQAAIAAVIGVGTQYTLPVIDPQDITTLLPLYVVYKASYTRQTLSCLTAAATALVLGAVF